MSTLLSSSLTSSDAPTRYRAGVHIMERGAAGALTDEEKEAILFERNLIRHEARHGPLHMKLDTPDR